MDVLPRETVTLVCDCLGLRWCEGRFKLRFLGSVVKTWLYPTSQASEVAAAIMTTPGVFSNNEGHVETPVLAKNNTEQSAICKTNAITRTRIEFKRNHGDLPSLSMYANQITRGSVYFEVSYVRLS